MIHSPRLRIVPDGHASSRPASPECRALVLAGTPSHGRKTRTPPARASAPFLAQLIATAQQTPQTREKRRMEPAAAIAAYIEIRKYVAN